MKCYVCGGERVESHVGAYRADMGLDEKVTLLGIDLIRCPDCGDEGYSIPRMEELFQVLAQAVVNKGDQLTPKEVAFLRKHLGLNNEEFAGLMGVSLEQARRWQREGDSPIPRTAERLLCALILGRADVETIRKVAVNDERKPLRSKMCPVNDQWQAVPL